MVTKTVGNHSLLSIGITTGFTVRVLASTSDSCGTAVRVNQGGANGALLSLAPEANSDVSFYVNALLRQGSVQEHL